jgi:PAS domain S-box-containing protein
VSGRTRARRIAPALLVLVLTAIGFVAALVAAREGEERVSGPAAALPWLILAAGLLLAGLAWALGVGAARRIAAQDELERLFALMPDLVVVADSQGRMVRVSPAIERILGYTPDEFMAKPYIDFVHPDDRERTASEAAAVRAGKPLLSFAARYRAKDGSYRMLEWMGQPFPEHGLMYGVARDATERRRAESEVKRLADEQAALRRVATLVAQGRAPTAVFDAVAAEMERLLEADGVVLGRYEAGEEITVVAARGVVGQQLSVGLRVSHAGNNVSTRVRRTGRPARAETTSSTGADITRVLKELGVRAAVGAPIIVDGRVWGVVMGSWAGEGKSPSSETEGRMAEFAQLLDTAIANADSRDQLNASRARLLTEADEARRRVVRDLHDGAQQRFVHSIVMLKLALQALERGDGTAKALVAEALAHATLGTEELRELSHGILPTVLTRGGLRAALQFLVGRLALPVRLEAPDEGFPMEVEASAYFIVAEALTNVVKHARAERAEVVVAVADDVLHIDVRDDGVGGADPSGHGLVGMSDRATALGGTIEIDSPESGGTHIVVGLPLTP